MTEREAIIQLRQLAKDLLSCECFQSVDGWTEDACKEWGCKFLVGDDCEVQTRYQTLMEETNPEPDFDEWVRAGMPTDTDVRFGF